MKKLLFGCLALFALAGCSGESDLDVNSPKVPAARRALPSTEVYVGGTLVTSYTDGAGRQVRASSYTGATYDNVYFYLRVDNRIPGVRQGYSPNLYFPQNAGGGSRMEGRNRGRIMQDYAYRYLGMRGVNEYVFDDKGLATAETFVEAPTLDDLLAANQNTSISASLANIDRNQAKILWYVVKYQPADYVPGQQGRGAWHVDGVLTLPTTQSVTEIPGMNIGEAEYMTPSTPVNQPEPPTPPSPNPPSGEGEVENGNYVKVDLHQQMHKDWEAIKTTIHIGATVEKVKVTIPLGRADVAEKDDFALRTYDAYYTIKSDMKIFQQMIEAEYAANSGVTVLSWDDYAGVKSDADRRAADTASGEVFVVSRNSAIERIFYVQAGDLYEYNYLSQTWNEGNSHNLKVHVAHEENQMVIEVRHISPDVINAQTAVNPDGLTIEVWSYPRPAEEGEDATAKRREVYQRLQQATVSVTGGPAKYSATPGANASDGKVYTEASSAFFE